MRDQSPPAGVEPLPIPVPPMLEAAMGYTHGARWWALYYASTEASWTDGQRSRGGASWACYREFMNHPAVTLVTRGDYFAQGEYDFGSDDGPPTHYMVIDSVERRAYVMAARDAEAFLRRQWLDPHAPPTPPLVLTDDDLRQMADDFRNDLAASNRDVAEAIRRDYVNAMELKAWMDRTPQGQAAGIAMRDVLERDLDVYLSPRMDAMPGRVWRGGRGI